MNTYPDGLVFFRRPEIEAMRNHVAGRLVKHDELLAAPEKRESLTIE
jgi:hypothetical protein